MRTRQDTSGGSPASLGASGLHTNHRAVRSVVLAMAAAFAAAIPTSADSGTASQHCATTSGAGVITENGSLLLVGQALGGTTGTRSTRAVVGFGVCAAGSLGTVFFGDCDGDRAITEADHKCFVECMAGPGAPLPLRSCEPMDINRSTHVDLADFARFVRAIQPQR